MVHRSLQTQTMWARNPVATIQADGLQSVAGRRGARAAVVTPGRANQQVSSKGDGVVSRVVELEDAPSIGEGRRTRDANFISVMNNTKAVGLSHQA